MGQPERDSSTNILDLGPIHAKVIAHLQCLIADVDLVLGPSASHETATLRRLLVTFLEGALDTWVRFCGEFNENNKRRQRRRPRDSPYVFAASTAHVIQNFLRPGAQKRLLKKARAVNTRGDERKRRVAQANYDKERVRKNKQLDVRRKERRDAAEAKLTAVVPRLTLAEVKKLRVDEINLQIRWHRRFDKDVPGGETHPKNDTQHSMEQPDGSNNAQGMPGCEDEYDDE